MSGGPPYYCSGAGRHEWSTQADAEKCCKGYRGETRHVRGADGEDRIVLTLVPDPPPPSWNYDPATAPPPVTLSDDAGPTVPLYTPIAMPKGLVRTLAELAEDGDDTSDDYRELAAAVGVIRLLDKERAATTGLGTEITFREFLMVQRAVDGLTPGPGARVLADIVGTISAFGTEGKRGRSIVPLLAYATQLEHRGYWDGAVDVLLAAIGMMPDPRSPASSARGPDADRELLPVCCERAAHGLRRLGDLDRAADLCEQGLAAIDELLVAVAAAGAAFEPAPEDGPRRPFDGAEAQWRYRWFLLRVERAIITFEKGNLPAAAADLDHLIALREEAGPDAVPSLLGRALHERGQVAYAADEDEMAAALFYRAASLHEDPDLVQRAQVDLAVALDALGETEHAQMVCEMHRTAPTRPGSDVPAVAGINLMRLAHRRGDPGRAAFDALYAALGTEKIRGRLRAHYHLFAAQGFLRYGETQRAHEELERAVTVARRFRVNKLLVAMDQLLRATDDDETPRRKRRTSPEARETLRPVLDDIRYRRGSFAGAAPA